jgi:hypothetical protein
VACVLWDELDGALEGLLKRVRALRSCCDRVLQRYHACQEERGLVGYDEPVRRY